uniref:Uncharacterized protein n=1 Tax=Knipowitschia caucasica TaxID=637954 RepID=A0AAV2IY83_KNICA
MGPLCAPAWTYYPCPGFETLHYLITRTQLALHSHSRPTVKDIRKQEELVYSVRKRLEEALMADMLPHVEEAANRGETQKEEGNTSEGSENV